MEEPSTYKAQRRTIYLGDIPLEVAMLPNGEYCLSQTQVASVIDKSRDSMLYFSRSKYFKSLFDKGFECWNLGEKLSIEGANKPINPIPIDVACLYWHKWAASGNSKAQRLVLALLKHTLYELADEAFEVYRTTKAKNQSLKEDLSSQGLKPIGFLEQEYTDFLEFPAPETETERELKLKIELARLELEKEKIKHLSLDQTYEPSEIRKLGTFRPEVLIHIKDRLKLHSWEEAAQFMEKFNFGRESGKWVSVKISGEILVLPWSSLHELQRICTQIKAQQN